jgi:peroxiredoxin
MQSDLFTGKAIEYLMYYRNPQLPKELLAKEFNSAVDSILNRAKANQAVYKHITGYLIDGFKQFGFEECINYILENYVIKDDLCLEGSGNTIQRMIDQRKRLAAGTLAPGIVLPDTSGAPVSLKEMKGEKTLVLFYSTACPHCQRMIPRISEIVRHEAEGRLAVLAVSLDESRADWLQFVAANKLSWRNVNDPAGWGGRAAADYCIYATPTMILLDREKRIIARPLTPEDLQKLL